MWWPEASDGLSPCSQKHPRGVVNLLPVVELSDLLAEPEEVVSADQDAISAKAASAILGPVIPCLT